MSDFVLVSVTFTRAEYEYLQARAVRANEELGPGSTPATEANTCVRLQMDRDKPADVAASS
jgi:hypothetical protein